MSVVFLGETINLHPFSKDFIHLWATSSQSEWPLCSPKRRPCDKASVNASGGPAAAKGAPWSPEGQKRRFALVLACYRGGGDRYCREDYDGGTPALPRAKAWLQQEGENARITYERRTMRERYTTFVKHHLGSLNTALNPLHSFNRNLSEVEG